MAQRTAAVSRMIDDYIAPLDTSGWTLLRLADSLGPVRSSELAQRSGMSRPSVSRCVTALERAGLIVADADPDDGRATLVRPTDEGRAYLDRITTVGHQRMHAITDGFTADEVDTLARLLARLNDNADGITVVPARYRLETTSA